MVRGREQVFDSKDGAYVNEEIRDKLASVVRQQVDRRAVYEYPMGHEGRSHCARRDILKRNGANYLQIYISDNQEKAVPAAGSNKFTEDVNRDIFQGSIGSE